MRVFLIRIIALLIILWAGLQPGAPLNPIAAPSATTSPSSLLASTPSPSPESTLVDTPSPLPASPSPSPILTPAATNPVNSSATIRFAVIGDYGSGGRDEKAVAEMVRGWQPDFIITTGDNNYSAGAAVTIDLNVGQYYHEFIYPYYGEQGDGASFNRFFPTLGNHDWRTSNGQPYLDYFTLPGNERYYDFVQRGERRWIDPVVEHNRRDVVALAILLARIVGARDGS